MYTTDDSRIPTCRAFEVRSQDHSEALCVTVRKAYTDRTPLIIHASNTKAFYGRITQGEPVDVSAHRGVVNYEPTELVISARAGTSLAEIGALLVEHDQMLPFEPPHFGDAATIGGCVAAGLSGPRRPWGGAVRDNLLGVEIINGKGERLKFGGEVMKNVAGYDVSRLMAGSLGTLGILLQVSIKVLPRPSRVVTLAHPANAERALRLMHDWARRPLPISATWHFGQNLYTRLEGGEQTLEAAVEEIDGNRIEGGEKLWRDVREQVDPFFDDERSLWRVSVPPVTPALDIAGETATEWGGSLRWIKTDAPPSDVRRKAAAAGGHATLFRGGNREDEVFHPLSGALMAVHRRVKQALDPRGLFNPGRLYRDL